MRHSAPSQFLLATAAISVAFFLILNSALFADGTNDEVLIHNRHQLSAQLSPCHTTRNVLELEVVRWKAPLNE